MLSRALCAFESFCWRRCAVIKFLFSRMTEPEVSGPTWDSTDTPWKASDNLQEPIWRAQYDWHCGRPDKPSWDAGAAAQGGVEDLAAQLQSIRSGKVDGRSMSSSLAALPSGAARSAADTAALQAKLEAVRSRIEVPLVPGT